MTEKELNTLIDKLRGIEGENEWIEYKVDNMNPEEIGKRISALSNGACLVQQQFGYIVFGIEDKTKKIIGTSKFLTEKKKGNEDIEHWLITRLNPRIDFRLYNFNRGTFKISIIQIPAATNQPVTFLHNAYIRVGSITRKLSDFPEKERKIWKNESNESFELKIAKDNIDINFLLEFLDYPTYYELLSLPIPKTSQEIIRKFEEEKYVINRDLKFAITNLGAILFAKNLNQFEGLYRKSIRLIVYNGKNRIKTEREFSGKKGYAFAFSNLIDFLEAILPKNEVIEKALRKEVAIYPNIALRELIANALIHQDFHIRGSGPMIEVFSDRIEISNPGKPLIDVLRFIDSSPLSRNEKLAFHMRRLNICEERGSGIDKVIGSCEVYQLPAPEFILDDNFTRIKLFSPKTLRQMDKADKIRACYQHCSLKYVSGEKMTNSSLRERFNISEKNYSMASRIIAEGIKSGLIKDADPESSSKKHAKYIPFWA